MTDEKKTSNKPNNKRPNNRYKKNNSNNNNRRRPGGQAKNRRPKSLTPTRVLQKYDNLLDQYLVARKKFYEFYARAQGKQLDKIKRNVETSLKSLRDFEKNLNDWQQELLAKRLNVLPEDRDYSKSRDIKPEGEYVSFDEKFEEIHLLPTQINADYSQDNEESSGSIDDYLKYKGQV